MNMMEGKDDAISRRAARDAMLRLYSEDLERYGVPIPEMFDAARAAEAINELPAVQPEIIRCKECKHSEHWYKDKRRCFLWHETGIDVFEDGYCNYAERKDNGRPDQQAGCNC